MIVGTIVGTGIICMFALISGLAFGGVRIVVKRMLPDKVFDRSDQMQILQLGLSSKPIKAEDFYSLGTPQKG
jgi:predicted small integral membrane protein